MVDLRPECVLTTASPRTGRRRMASNRRSQLLQRSSLGRLWQKITGVCPRLTTQDGLPNIVSLRRRGFPIPANETTCGRNTARSSFTLVGASSERKEPRPCGTDYPFVHPSIHPPSSFFPELGPMSACGGTREHISLGIFFSGEYVVPCSLPIRAGRLSSTPQQQENEPMLHDRLHHLGNLWKDVWMGCCPPMGCPGALCLIISARKTTELLEEMDDHASSVLAHPPSDGPGAPAAADGTKNGFLKRRWGDEASHDGSAPAQRASREGQTTPETDAEQSTCGLPSLLSTPLSLPRTAGDSTKTSSDALES